MANDFRVGAVSYINARPLTIDLDETTGVLYDVPSKLAKMLNKGEIDVGLVPILEYFSGTQYTILPDISISSSGPVRSVLLISRIQPNEIKQVALDAHSLSSAALLKVLAAKRLQLKPNYVPMNIARNGVEETLNSGPDAVLVIGDPALKAATTRHHIVDLGEVWTNFTGRPFVYAAWLAREGVDLDAATARLQQAKQNGLQKIETIAETASNETGMPREQIADYLHKNVAYDLGEKEIDGLIRFKDYCLELNLIQNDENIRIHDR